ncbi:MAG TPA: PilZ domain-containing protein [Candidatus Sulfotelmatobacter sp.]|nr:PilZ domain-containing protein [Candidatus Sulfotelmatobacter sp.]
MAENQVKQNEKRLSTRAKFSKMLRVRPSEPKETHFEDLPISVNVSKHGIYFHSNRSDYHKGMRLFVTFPFTFVNDPSNCEYLAEVVRVESLTNDRFGVGIRLLMTV